MGFRKCNVLSAALFYLPRDIGFYEQHVKAAEASFPLYLLRQLRVRMRSSLCEDLESVQRETVTVWKVKGSEQTPEQL